MDEEESKQKQHAIQGHYLFPVVELLMSKCEKATVSLDDDVFDVEDVYKLMHDLKEKTTEDDVKNQDEEINQLIFNVIYMLRVHLLELSKLRKLVEKFKSKYTAVLKKTFARESEMTVLSDSDDDSFMDDLYPNGFPLAHANAFLPGSFMSAFAPLPESTEPSQNQNLLPNIFNQAEKMLVEQQNNYLMHLAFLANNQSITQAFAPTSLASSKLMSKHTTSMVDPKTKKK